jgi:LAS superfamily LD-carboxypeptidase LdcB
MDGKEQKIWREILSGMSTYHLIPAETTFLHPATAASFYQLQQRAKKEAGIELAIASGYRSYQRQLSLWNEKAQGKRTIWNADASRVFDVEREFKNDSSKLLFSILRWSAIPGAGRHHWGSDFDVYDLRPFKNTSNKLQLIPSEYAVGGILEELGKWLIQTLPQTSFYRPYASSIDHASGVAPEPWHLSHREVVGEFAQKFTLDFFRHHIEERQEEILLGDEIQKNLERVFTEFIERYF